MKELTAESFESLTGDEAVFEVEAFGGTDGEGNEHQPITVPIRVSKVLKGEPLDGVQLPDEEACVERVPFTVVFEGQKLNDAGEGTPPLPENTYTVRNAKLGEIGPLHIAPYRVPRDPQALDKGVCDRSRFFAATFN